jgi:hypothetical protein
MEGEQGTSITVNGTLRAYLQHHLFGQVGECCLAGVAAVAARVNFSPRHLCLLFNPNPL